MVAGPRCARLDSPIIAASGSATVSVAAVGVPPTAPGVYDRFTRPEAVPANR